MESQAKPPSANIQTRRWIILSALVLLTPPLPFIGTTGRHLLFGLELATLLEWAGVGLSIFSFGLSYYHFKLSRNAALPLLGAALMLAGITDALPLLSLARWQQLFAPAAPIHYRASWVACHFIGVFILAAALAIVFLSSADKREKSLKHMLLGSGALGIMAAMLCGLVWLTVHLYKFHPPALAEGAGRMTRVGASFAALAGIFCLGASLFRRFHQRTQSAFSLALMLSLVPRAGAVLDIGILSAAPFDAWFYAGSISKFLSCLIPYVGLALDYLKVSKELRAQVLESKRTEVALLGRQASLNAQNRVIVKLARNPALAAGALDEACREIVESSVEVLGVDKGSIWLLDDGRASLVCHSMYERFEKRHSSGYSLGPQVTDELLTALEGERLLSISDSRFDRHCPPHFRDYLAGSGSRAALAAPIRVGGMIAGIVVLEQAGAAGGWEPHEDNFVGSLGDLAALALDAAERARTEEALSVTEQRFRRYFELSPSGFSISTTDRRYIEVNSKFCEMLGYTREELLGRTWSDQTCSDDQSVELPLYDKLLRGEIESYSIDKRYLRKDGSLMSASVSAACIRHADGSASQCIALIQDISERKRTEDELRYRLEFEKLIAALSSEFINLPPGGADAGVTRALAAIGRFAQVDRSYIFLFSEDGCRLSNTHEWCSENCPSLLAQLKDLPTPNLPWLVSKITHLEAIHAADVSLLPPIALSELETLRPGPLSSMIAVPLALGGSAIGFLGFDSVGAPRRWAAESSALLKIVAEMFINVFERKQNEELLRVAQFALNQAADAVFWLDQTGRFIYVNEVACSSLGWSRAELLSMAVADIDPSVDSVVWRTHWRRIKKKGSVTLESVMRTKTGEELMVEITSNWFRSGDKEFLYALVRDIRERKEAAAILEQQRAFLRQIIDINPNFIFTKDRQGRFTLANLAVAEAYGTTPEGLIGKSDVDFNPNREQVEHFARYDREVIDTGREIVIPEESITDAKGRKRWLQTVKRPLFDQSGHAAYVLGVATDITLRKLAEDDRRKLERQIQHMQKLESLGVLAGGIAHDFNNLLMGMLGNAGLALMELPADSPTLKRLEQIKTASHRASELTNQLLAYSGKGRFFVQPVQLSTVVEEMGSLLSTIVSKKAAIHYDFQTDLPDIEADPTQIRQVVMNLITNASDALGERSGEIHVRTGVLTVDHRFVEDDYLKDAALDGTYVMLEVRDTGSGMDQETLAKIFDPFFTTKFTGRGLGLAAVLGIVRGHHGTLKVQSTPGEGTTFRVLFPAVPAPSLEIAVPQAAADLGGTRCSGAILVVDDEHTARTVAKEMLEQFGFRVITATDGREAVDTYRSRAAEISAVLLDMTMPNMDGMEAFEELKKIAPDIRVVLTSGYTEQDATSRFSGLAGFIQKPYSPNELILKMRGILN